MSAGGDRTMLRQRREQVRDLPLLVEVGRLELTRGQRAGGRSRPGRVRELEQPAPKNAKCCVPDLSRNDAGTVIEDHVPSESSADRSFGAESSPNPSGPGSGGAGSDRAAPHCGAPGPAWVVDRSHGLGFLRAGPRLPRRWAGDHGAPRRQSHRMVAVVARGRCGLQRLRRRLRDVRPPGGRRVIARRIAAVVDEHLDLAGRPGCQSGHPCAVS
jgi:hypothetical protein